MLKGSSWVVGITRFKSMMAFVKKTMWSLTTFFGSLVRQQNVGWSKTETLMVGRRREIFQFSSGFPLKIMSPSINCLTTPVFTSLFYMCLRELIWEDLILK